jgi:hypothetical protein
MDSQPTQPRPPMSWRQLLPKITLLAREGLSAADIGLALNQPPKRIERIARNAGVRLAGPGGYRKIHCGVRKRHHEKIAAVAAQTGQSPARITELVVGVMMDKPVSVILKEIGKESRQKRRYTYRNRKPKIQAEAAE